MKKPLNWKQIGQFFSVILNLFAIVRDTFTAQGVGLEIIGWMTGEGKDEFVEKFLKPLGEQFLAASRVIVVNEYTIRVNLDAVPMLSFDGAFDGAAVEVNKAGGWVTVQKRADGLYVDDRKVILYRSERQQNGKVVGGYELRDEVTNLPVLHPNIMDALYEHSHLIPEDWKQDENGNTRFIYFWAVTFRDSDGDVCVRCLFWLGGVWNRGYDWLNDKWVGDEPAAVLASN